MLYRLLTKMYKTGKVIVEKDGMLCDLGRLQIQIIRELFYIDSLQKEHNGVYTLYFRYDTEPEAVVYLALLNIKVLDAPLNTAAYLASDRLTLSC